MYDYGDGIEKDLKQAAYWYQKAADQGKARAQTNLGVMYFEGDGVSKDRATGYMWINLAASNDDNARSNREKMEKLMTSEEIAEGQRLTREWLVAHPKPSKK
jgi:TPR repeat protein